MSEPRRRSAQVWHALSTYHKVLPTTHALIDEWNEPHLLLPSQPKLVLIIDRPRKDGRLSLPMHHNGGCQSNEGSQMVVEIRLQSHRDQLPCYNEYNAMQSDPL